MFKKNKKEETRTPYNIVQALSLQCNDIKETKTGNLIFNSFIKAKKRDDGTYPAPTWVSVIVTEKTDIGTGFETVQDVKEEYENTAISVDGTIKADSWTDRNGEEHTQLIIFAGKVYKTYKN